MKENMKNVKYEKQSKYRKVSKIRKNAKYEKQRKYKKVNKIRKNAKYEEQSKHRKVRKKRKMEREGKVLQARNIHVKLTNKQRENQKMIKKEKNKGCYIYKRGPHWYEK